MAHRLACEAADVFQAVASVAGTNAMGTDSGTLSACRSAYAKLGNASHPPPPVSILSLHGSDDVYVPYNGSLLLGLQAVGDTIGAWADMQSCSRTPTHTSSHSGRMRTSRWHGCSGGTALLHSLLVQGVGHEWIVNKGLGIHASEVVLDFFDSAAIARGLPVDPSSYASLPPEALWPGHAAEGSGQGDPLAEGIAALSGLFNVQPDGAAGDSWKEPGRASSEAGGGPGMDLGKGLAALDDLLAALGELGDTGQGKKQASTARRRRG